MADENLLLAQLPVDVRERVRSLSTSVRFPEGQTVLHPGEPVRDVYFPTTGWIALEPRIVRFMKESSLLRQVSLPADWST
jgi:hypothetical protein